MKTQLALNSTSTDCSKSKKSEKGIWNPPESGFRNPKPELAPEGEKTVFYWFSLITVPCFPCFKGEEKGREEINGHQLNNRTLRGHRPAKRQSLTCSRACWVTFSSSCFWRRSISRLAKVATDRSYNAAKKAPIADLRLV